VGQVGRQAAEAIVSTEFNDDDFWMDCKDGWEAGDGVLGSGAASALIDYFVVVAVSVEALLQEFRIGLAGLQVVAGGNAVSKANQDRRGCTE